MCDFNDIDIETVYANKKIALAVTEGLRLIDRRKFQLGITLKKESLGWVVKDLDWLPPDEEEKFLKKFVETFPNAKVISKRKTDVPVEVPWGESLCVTGRVLDRPGGKVVPGVTIKMWSDWTRKSRFAVADEQGSYRFDDVEPGPYTLRISEQPAGIWSEAVWVFAVQDPQGKRSRRTQLVGTGQEGLYRLAEVGTGPGQYQLTEQRRTLAFEALVVTDHNQRQQRIDLHQQLLQSISGTVRDAETGKPVPGARIHSRSFIKSQRAEVKTDANGQYCLYVSPGQAGIGCQGTPERYYPSQAMQDMSKKASVRAGRHVRNIDFQVYSAPRFTGKVDLPDGSRTPEGLDVWTILAWRDKRLREGRLPGGRFYQGNTTLQLKTDEHGGFTGYLRSPFGQDNFEHCDVFIVAYALTPDDSMGGFARTKTIDLKSPQIDPIEIVLEKTGSAEFRVVGPDTQGVTDARIVGLSDSYWSRGTSQLSASVQHLGQGRYRISGLVPGLGFVPCVKAPGYRHNLHKYPRDGGIVVAANQHIEAPDIELEWWGEKAVPKLIDDMRIHDEGIPHNLGLIGPDARAAVPAIVRLLENSTEETACWRAAEALGKIGVPSERAIKVLIEALESKPRQIANAAAESLGRLRAVEAIGPIEAALEAGRIESRFAAPALWRIEKAGGVALSSLISRETTWGEAVEGLAVRLRAKGATTAKRVTLLADARNDGPGTYSGTRSTHGCWLKVDGKWYWRVKTGEIVAPMLLKAGDRQLAFTRLRLSSEKSHLWRGGISTSDGLVPPPLTVTVQRRRSDKPLELTPGRHWVRLALPTTKRDGKTYAYSNPVEIEILPIEKKTAVQVEGTRITAEKESEFSAILPNGVTVELIGMCEYPSVDKQWWQPDGSLLVKPPYDESDIDILSFRKPNAIPIEFAFRLSGNLGEPAWEAQVKGDEQAFVWWTGRRAKDGEFLTDIKSIGMFVKSDQRTLDLRLGFSFADRLYEWVDFKNISIKPNFKPDVQVEGEVIEKMDSLYWGKEVNGLRAAVEFVPEKESYSLGERVGVRFHIQNVSDHNIQITSTSWRQTSRVFVQDDEGKEISVKFRLFSGIPRIVRYILKPRETVVLESSGLGFGDAASTMDINTKPVTGNFIRCGPGRYFIHYKLNLPDVTRGNIGDWEGILETGKRKLVLTSTAESDQKPAVRVEVEKGRDSTELAQLLEKLKNADHHREREAAAQELGELRDTHAVGALIAALKDTDVGVRKAAACALGKIGDERAVEPLIETYQDKEYESFVDAIWALGDIGGTRAEEILVQALSYQGYHPSVRNIAAKCLTKLGWEPANREQKIRYLIALEKWEQAIKSGPSALLKPAGTNQAEGPFELNIPIVIPLEAEKQTPAISKYPWLQFSTVQGKLKSALDIQYSSWPHTKWVMKIDVLDAGGTVLGQAKSIHSNSGMIMKYILVENAEVLFEFDRGLELPDAASFRFSIESFWASRGNPIQFDKELPLALELNSAEQSRTIRAQWLKFQKSGDRVEGTIHLDYLSWPKAKWKVDVYLFDENGTQLTGYTAIIENSGIIRGRPTMTMKDFRFSLGKWGDISKAVRYGVTMQRILDSTAKTAVQVDEEASTLKLKRLGTVLLAYAKEHDGEFPSSYPVVLPRIKRELGESDFSWYVRHIKYIGKHKRVSEDRSRIIAYNKIMLKQGEGTDVLFPNGDVGFIEAPDLKSFGLKVPGVKEESAENLMQLGIALLIYARDHEGVLPSEFELDPIRQEMSDSDFRWCLGHAEYIGQGKKPSFSSWNDRTIEIAYDKTLLRQGEGTNVLFMDCRVEFLGLDRLEELGIPAFQVEGEEGWGEAVDGIICAVKPVKESFFAGEIFEFDITYKNVSDHPITVCTYPDYFYVWTRLEILASKGNTILSGMHASGLYLSLKASDFATLEPGQTASVRQKIEGYKLDLLGLPIPGKYAAKGSINEINRMHEHIPKFDEFCRKNNIKPWTGSIKSGPAAFMVIPMPEIQWGEEAEGLHVGIGELEVKDGSIKVPAFLRNKRSDDKKYFDGADYQIILNNKLYLSYQWPALNGRQVTVYPEQVRGPFWIDLSDYVNESDRDQSYQADRPLKQLPKGKYNLRVIYVGRNGKPRISSPEINVTIPDVSSWGEAVEGVQVRLRAEKMVWKEGEVPMFTADVRNDGKRNLVLPESPDYCLLEFDEQWFLITGYEPGEKVAMGTRLLDFDSGKKQKDIAIKLSDKWETMLPSELELGASLRSAGIIVVGPGLRSRLRLTPGKHTIRVRYILDPSHRGVGINPPEPVQVVSNPVNIEILPTEKKPDVPVEGESANKLKEGPRGVPNYSDLKEAIKTAYKGRQRA
ncbi:MAG: HEAT repeat domain-containing protein [Planctomycetota bacterium]|jgi:HEAT repeat protein/protocatechuate 3,4-dioxygenase beta subunit